MKPTSKIDSLDVSQPYEPPGPITRMALLSVRQFLTRNRVLLCLQKLARPVRYVV
jgi:hypothetical protein